MELFWWFLAAVVLIGGGAWISSALAFGWLIGAGIGLLIWLIALMIRSGAFDGMFFLFLGD